MRILVTFAVDAEFAPWRNLRHFVKGQKGGFAQLFRSSAGNTDIAVLLTGIGLQAVSAALEFFVQSRQPSPDVVISSGMAGALSAQFQVGDIVVAQTTRTLKNDARAETDPVLLELAAQKGAAVLETMITALGLASTAAEKARLAFFGQAVEMESAIVLSHFSSRAQIAAIRVISDTAGEDLPVDFDRCLTPQGAIRPIKLVNQIVRRPSSLPQLIAFGKQSHAAARKLAQFLDVFVASVPVLPEKAAVA